MSVKIDDYKDLERHPLSADYKDLKGKARSRIKEGMTKFGFLPDRPVVLAPDAADGGKVKVLDGWQRHTIALELGVEPIYRNIPDGIDQTDYVLSINDARRHESPDVIEKRIKERVVRAAKLAKSGVSVRQQAEEEGVSVGTAHRDREAAEAAGMDTTPEDGKVTGRNKRKYTAGKIVLCPRCTRVGKTRNCPKCKEVRAKAKDKGPTKAPGVKNGSPPFDLRKFKDGYGIVLREVDSLGRTYNCKESEPLNKLRDQAREFRLNFENTARQAREDALAAIKRRVEAAKLAAAPV